MTELSFLIDLLLNGRLQKAVQEKVKARISEVEQNMSLPQAIRQQQRQSPQANTDATAVALQASANAEGARAMQDRQATIQAAVNQKPIEVASPGGSRGPRKF